MPQAMTCVTGFLPSAIELSLLLVKRCWCTLELSELDGECHFRPQLFGDGWKSYPKKAVPLGDWSGINFKKILPGADGGESWSVV